MYYLKKCLFYLILCVSNLLVIFFKQKKIDTVLKVIISVRLMLRMCLLISSTSFCIWTYMCMHTHTYINNYIPSTAHNKQKIKKKKYISTYRWETLLTKLHNIVNLLTGNIFLKKWKKYSHFLQRLKIINK